MKINMRNIPSGLLYFLTPLFLFLLGAIFVTPAFASSYQLSGTVKDSNGTGVSATVDVYNAGTTTDVVPPVTADGSGNYIFPAVPQGTYDIKVTSDPGTGLTSAIVLNKTITADTLLNFILVPTSDNSVIFSGQILDAQGIPLNVQSVQLNSPTVGRFTGSTDSSGNFSLTVPPASDYTVMISSTNFSAATGAVDQTIHTPDNYVLQTSLDLMESKMMDLTLPFKQVAL